MPERASKRRAAISPSAAGASRTASRSAAATLIAVDIGNSDTVVGLFDGEELRGFWRLTSGPMTADEVRIRVDQLVRSLDSAGPAGEARSGAGRAPGLAGQPPAEGAVLCSVVPALTLPWAEALERWTGKPPVEVGVATARSLPIRYHDPTAVGADRIANAIAARDLYGTPAIVVDLGTATTFDCVSEAGEYLGGAIAPGVGTSAEELFRRAARIPRVELRRPERALGRTTEESLRAGVLWGAAGQVDALVRRLALEMNGTPQVVATGGWAKIVAGECETVQQVDEALTLKGMRILWEEQV